MKYVSRPHTCSFPANLAPVFCAKIRGTLPPHRWRVTRLMTSTEILLEAENLRKIYRRSGTVFSRESEGARFTAVDSRCAGSPSLAGAPARIRAHLCFHLSQPACGRPGRHAHRRHARRAILGNRRRRTSPPPANERLHPRTALRRPRAPIHLSGPPSPSFIS